MKMIKFIMMAQVLWMMAGCASMGVGSIPMADLKKKYDVKDSDFVKVNGVDIHFQDEGDGPVLVLLHGICASLYTWDGWTRELKDRYRIIRLDLPGWGLTGPVGKDSYDLNKMLGIMEAFLKERGVTTCFMAGNSLGGYFAWNYSVRHPEQVTRLVLLDPVCYPQTPPWFIRAAKYSALTFLPRYMLPKVFVSMNLRAVYGDETRIDPGLYDLYFDLAMREGNKNSYQDMFQYMARESSNTRLSEGVSGLKIPVLLMYGSKDKWVPPDHAKLWERDVPGVECIVYPGVGHVPMEEIPGLTSKDADKFFRRSSDGHVAATGK